MCERTAGDAHLQKSLELACLLPGNDHAMHGVTEPGLHERFTLPSLPRSLARRKGAKAKAL